MLYTWGTPVYSNLIKFSENKDIPQWVLERTQSKWYEMSVPVHKKFELFILTTPFCVGMVLLFPF